jgi:nitroreductase
MFDLEQVIRERHSTRLFLPLPVPRALVEVCWFSVNGKNDLARQASR